MQKKNKFFFANTVKSFVKIKRSVEFSEILFIYSTVDNYSLFSVPYKVGVVLTFS